MTNFWKETIELMNEKDVSFNDVVAIYGDNFQITKENFEKIAKITEYYDGFGLQQVAADLKILGKNFIMYRAEYDGSEWWEFSFIGDNIPKEIRHINRLCRNDIISFTLEEMNREDK